MYYYGARYYSPWLCRFISVDPKAGKYVFQTPYAYADNNPINKMDYNGEGTGEGAGNSSGGASATPSQHTIKEGDKFWDLENKYGLVHGTLQKLNPNADPKNLKIGSTINLTDKTPNLKVPVASLSLNPKLKQIPPAPNATLRAAELKTNEKISFYLNVLSSLEPKGTYGFQLMKLAWEGGYSIVDNIYVWGSAIKNGSTNAYHLNGSGAWPKEVQDAGIYTLLLFAPSPTTATTKAITNPGGVLGDFGIPKFYTYTSGGNSVYVSPHAMKHLEELAANGAKLGPDYLKLLGQLHQNALNSAIEDVLSRGPLKYNTPYFSGGNKIIFAPPRTVGELPAVKHFSYGY